MFECELKQYCNNDCEKCPYAKEQAKIQEVVEAVEYLKKAITDVFIPYLEAAFDSIHKLIECIMKAYPNKRVKHLAAHGKTARVRKKNRKRIKKWIEKGDAEK